MERNRKQEPGKLEYARMKCLEVGVTKFPKEYDVEFLVRYYADLQENIREYISKI